MLGNRQDAADAVQESMVKIWNHINDDHTGIRQPKAFAFRILRTTAIDILRRRPLDGMFETAEPPESVVEKQDAYELTECLNMALASLPQAQREVLVLNALEGFPATEIAEITGLSRDNVRQLLSRGRRRLKEIYLKLSES